MNSRKLLLLCFFITLMFCVHADEYTKLLIHSNESLGSTQFSDFSDSNHTISASGDVHHTDLVSKFGNRSISFDGDGDKLTISDSEDWNFASGLFTIDFWIRIDSSPGLNSIIHQCESSSSKLAFMIYISDTDSVRFLYSQDGSTPLELQTPPIIHGQWYHVAVVQTETDIKMFLNGTLLATQVNTGLYNSDVDIEIGAHTLGGYSFNGYLDEIRISKGIARWTDSFTPPSEEYFNSTFPLSISQVGNQMVELSWQEQDNINNYIIKYGTQSGSYSENIDVAQSTSHMFVTLTNDQKYYFKIEALDAAQQVISESIELFATPYNTKWTTQSNHMSFHGGYVGIGTDNPQSEFAVNGTITCRELKVRTDGWADHVFSDQYQLMSFSELNNYIKTHKHLPNIPSEQSLLNQGVNVNQMLTKHMEKIEELTLYILELKKENDHLKNRVLHLEQSENNS